MAAKCNLLKQNRKKTHIFAFYIIKMAETPLPKQVKENLMKKIVIFLSAFLFSFIIIAQNATETCTLGFTFEISENPNWGLNEPVVVSITPGSPAARAGLKPNDIILEINGHGTYLKTRATLMSWFAENNTEMRISIRNIVQNFYPMTIRKDCRMKNAISEAQLSSVFAFYSLEDVQDRRFLIPVKTTTNKNAVFTNYKTFDFASAGEGTPIIDARINAIFERVLRERGITRNTENPDFIIQTYYSYQNNPLYKANSPTYGSYQNTWRFDMRNKRMIKIPVYSPSEAVRIDDIMYNLEFGYRFYDRKFLDPGEMTLIWESDVKERLSANYGLENYLEMNLPLILLKFPYPGNLNFGTYQVNHLKYNYTGINYDMNDLKTIVSVDAGSPAAIAGIQPGDVVMKIQNNRFNHNSKSLTQSYRRFIAETMNLRDQNTRYKDTNGFDNCMFWDITQYHNVSEAFADKRYKQAFSYLFNFNQYVDWNTPKTLYIELSREGESLNVEVNPEVTTNSSILVY